MCNLMENISVKENGNDGGLWDLFIFPWTVYHLCVTSGTFTCTFTCLSVRVYSCQPMYFWTNHAKIFHTERTYVLPSSSQSQQQQLCLLLSICKLCDLSQIQPTAKKRPDPKMYKKLIHKHTPPPPPPEAPSSELECPPLPPSAPPQGTPLSALPGKK